MPPDREFISVEIVREALECLYVNIELANTTLARTGKFVDSNADILIRAQTIRNVLFDCIEALRPLRPLPPHLSASQRSYEVLSLRYVSSLSIEEIAERLSVGNRQVYRDLRRAEDDLTVILDEPSADDQSFTSATAFKAEVDVLIRRQEMLALDKLLQSALTMVDTLARQKQVELRLQLPPQPVSVSVTPGIAKEMLIQLLSALIQQSPEGQPLDIRVFCHQDRAHICIDLSAPVLVRENSLLQEAILMAQLLEMAPLMQVQKPGRGHRLTLAFAIAHVQTVLVVEDNPGIGELYYRYLEGSPWCPSPLINPAAACERAIELQPVAIILDVLMPELDGWSVLQQLRSTPDVATIPVIICSVINDPELALALGATASLKKPLSRLELLDALRQATRDHSEAGPGARPSGSSPTLRFQ